MNQEERIAKLEADLEKLRREFEEFQERVAESWRYQQSMNDTLFNS